MSTDRMNQLRAYTGTYFNAALGGLRVVTLTGDRLHVMGLPLELVSDNGFTFVDQPAVKVTFSDEAEQLWLDDGATTTCYGRVEVADPTPRALCDYAGQYTCAELGVTWSLAVDGYQLVAQRDRFPVARLTPAFVDAFLDDWTPVLGYPSQYLLAFERDVNGDVWAFQLTEFGIRALQFVRQRGQSRFELPLLVADRLG